MFALAMTTSAELSRYYGLPVPEELLPERDENLTDLETEDLFRAHLSSNYGYFGSLDKTLSGFVILSNEGDDAWLFDARDTGAVWFQDHEERHFSPRFGSLADYAGWRADKAQHPDDEAVDARWALAEEPQPKRAVSTPDLAKRLQWAVWFFAQPTRDIGADSVNRETENGIGWFIDQVGVDPEALYARERPSLRQDPHLAASWLLVAAALGDVALARDIADAGPLENPLFSAFRSAVQGLGLSSSLEILPAFVHRKSRLLAETALRWDNVACVERMAQSLRAAPDEEPLARARWMVGLATKHGQRAALASLAKELGGHLVGALIQAQLAAAEGPLDEATLSRALQAVDDPAQPFAERTALFIGISAGIADPKRRLAGARALLEVDNFHFSALEVAAKAAAEAQVPEAASLSALYAALSEIRPIYSALATRGEASQRASALTKLATLDPEKKALCYRRILAAPETFHPQVLTEALVWSVASPTRERAEQWRKALGALGYGGGDRAVTAMREAEPEPSASTVQDIKAVLARDLPISGAPILQKSGQEAIVKALSGWLSAASGPGALDDLLERLERGTSATQQAIIGSALNPFDKGYVLKRMDNAQALRAAKVLVEVQKAGKGADLHLFHAAGHQLYRFSHPGAEAYFVAELAQNPSEELTANLYAAIRAMGTPSSRAAIIERLFSEPRSFWRLSSALSEIWSEETEAAMLAEIRRRPEAEAILGANHAAAALVEHVKRVPPLLTLGQLVLPWRPTDPEARGRLCYVLEVAGLAALREKRLGEAKTLLDAADALGAAPVSDYHAIDRDKPWVSPRQSDAEVKALVLDLRSGKLEAGQAEAKRASAKAKQAGKPQLKINDAKLADLAGAAFKQRLFHDRERGTVWFVSEDDRFFYFDGYEVKEPPFRVADPSDLHAFLAGVQAPPERAVFWTPSASAFVDVARFGSRILLGLGINNGAWSRYALVFPDEPAAAAALARFTASPPKGYEPSEPWYVARRGGIVRIVYRPNPDGSYSSDRTWCAAPEPEEVAAAERLYLETLRDHPGARVVSVEWLDSRRRDAESTVLEAMERRTNLRELEGGRAGRMAGELAALLAGAGFDPMIRHQETPPEDPALLRRLELVADARIRTPLTQLYQAVGSARVQVGSTFAELVPLSEIHSAEDVIARRGGRGAGFEDVKLSALAAMGYLGAGAIGWMLSSFVPGSIAELNPEVRGRLCGAPPGPECRRIQLSGKRGSAETLYRAMLDPERAYFWYVEGRVGGKFSWSTALHPGRAAAEKAFHKAIETRRAKGWVETPSDKSG
ncbi:MAG: hypothetical protein U1E65_06225 [Myxococcota bacterium]